MHDALYAEMRDQVVHYRYTGRTEDGYETPQFAAPVAISRCRVIRARKLIRKAEGQDVVSTVRVLFDQTVVVQEMDQFALSPFESPKSIAQITEAKVFGKLHHTRVFLEG